MLTSRKLGDTVPSWLELFLELVLIPEVKNRNGDCRINMEMDGQGITRPTLMTTFVLEALLMIYFVLPIQNIKAIPGVKYHPNLLAPTWSLVFPAAYTFPPHRAPPPTPACSPPSPTVFNIHALDSIFTSFGSP